LNKEKEFMKAKFKNSPLRGRIASLTLVGILLMAATAMAHHSFTAEFDQNKPVNLTGKVTEMKWSNPHAWIYIDVTTNGKTVNWACETGGANSLIRRGWRKEDLKYGTVLKMDGWQARNGTPTANVRSITLPNGQRLFAGSSNTAVEEK
jgi:uncharacterized protein DUF6152